MFSINARSPFLDYSSINVYLLLTFLDGFGRRFRFATYYE